MDDYIENKLRVRQYIDYTPYKLRDWIDEDNLDLYGLKSNPRALNYIIDKYGIKSLRTKEVHMGLFYMNPNSMLILEKEEKDLWYRQTYWVHLSQNPVAYDLLMDRIDLESTTARRLSYTQRIDWSYIPVNPCMLPMLESQKYKRKYKFKYDENRIGYNPNPLCMNLIKKLEFNTDLLYYVCANNSYDTTDYIKTHLDKMTKKCWNALSENKYAIKILEENMDKINWKRLSFNQNASRIIEQNMDKIYWENLSCNPGAIHILEKNIDKINWHTILANPNPNIEKIIEENLDNVMNTNNTPMNQEDYEKRMWYYLSQHPNLMNMLERNQDKIDYKCLSMNESIFEIDYEALDSRISIFKEELIGYAWNPERFQDWCLTDDERNDIKENFG